MLTSYRPKRHPKNPRSIVVIDDKARKRTSYDENKTVGIGITKLSPKTWLLAYKLVRHDGGPPTERGRLHAGKGLRYQVGRFYEENNYDTDRWQSCGAGLNVATLEWCEAAAPFDIRCRKGDGSRLLTVLFRPNDVVCVPFHNDGKVRVKRMYVRSSRKW